MVRMSLYIGLYWSIKLPISEFANVVDGTYGTNPAPVDKLSNWSNCLNLQCFIMCYASQVVQDFFHQQYDSIQPFFNIQANAACTHFGCWSLCFGKNQNLIFPRYSSCELVFFRTWILDLFEANTKHQIQYMQTVATRFQHYVAAVQQCYTERCGHEAISGLGVIWPSSNSPVVPVPSHGHRVEQEEDLLRLCGKLGIPQTSPTRFGPNPWLATNSSMSCDLDDGEWWWSSRCRDSWTAPALPWLTSTELCIPMTSKWVLIYMQG